MIETDALDPATLFPPGAGCRTCAVLRAAICKAAARGKETDINTRQTALDRHMKDHAHAD